MKEVRQKINQIIALLLSVILVMGVAPISILASETEVDEGKTSEIAAEASWEDSENHEIADEINGMEDTSQESEDILINEEYEEIEESKNTIEVEGTEEDTAQEYGETEVKEEPKTESEETEMTMEVAVPGESEYTDVKEGSVGDADEVKNASSDRKNAISGEDAFFLGKEFRAKEGTVFGDIGYISWLEVNGKIEEYYTEIISFQEVNGEVIATWINGRGSFSWPVYVSWDDSGKSFSMLLSRYGTSGYGLVYEDDIHGALFKGTQKDDGKWNISIFASDGRLCIGNTFELYDLNSQNPGGADESGEIEDSLTLEPSYSCYEGDSITITGTFITSASHVNSSLQTPDSNTLSFSNLSTLSPADTGEKNTWYVSVVVNTFIPGIYEMGLTVNGITETTSINVKPDSEFGICIYKRWDADENCLFLDDLNYDISDNFDVGLIQSVNNSQGKKVFVKFQDGKVSYISPLEEHIGIVKEYELEENEFSKKYATRLDINNYSYDTFSDSVVDWRKLENIVPGTHVVFYLYNNQLVDIEPLEYRVGRLDSRFVEDYTIYIDGANYLFSNAGELPYTSDLCDWEGKRIGYYIGSSKEIISGLDVVYEIVGLVNEEALIKLYSSDQDLEISTGDSMQIIASLVINGEISNLWTPSFVIGNNTVISMSDYQLGSLGYSIDITGLEEGTSSLIISDSETGAHHSISITVSHGKTSGKNYVYKIDTVPEFYPNTGSDNDKLTNFYNFYGIYISNYEIAADDTGTKVSFDAYNTNFMTGAVDVYDAKGKWILSEPIMKFKNIDSVYNTGKSLVYQIWDGVHGNYHSYTSELNSTWTPIEFNVPPGGHFSISNNIAVSPGVLLYNLTDYVGYVMEETLPGESDSSKFYSNIKKLFGMSAATNNSATERIRELFVEEFGNQIVDKFKDSISIGTGSIINETTGSIMGATTDDFTAFIESLGIGWEDVFEFSVDVGEGVFENISMPYGSVLESLFIGNKCLSLVFQTVSLKQSFNRSYITVHSYLDSRTSMTVAGVTVSYDEGVIDEDTVLQVFRIGAPENVWKVNGYDITPDQYTLYNICFVKNDEKVQPNGKCTVRIPAPYDAQAKKYYAYRQEPDGSWSKLSTINEGKYLVFETDHFSLYMITKDPQEESELDVVCSGSCGDNVSWSFLKDGTLTLTGTGKMTDFLYPSASPWYNQEVKNVIIDEGIINIGKNAFCDSAMISISLPESLETIGEYAFWGCSGLTSVHIPSGVTMIKPGAFAGASYGNSRLTSITVDNNNPAYMDIEGVVYSKDKETLVVFPAGKSGRYTISNSVQVIEDASFSGCKGLTGVSIPISVKKIGNYAFQGCSSLKDIPIPKGLSEIGKASFSETNINEVEIPETVCSIGENAFTNCYNLEEAVINSPTNKISNGTFSGCSSLKTVHLPNTINRIEKFVFLNCASLTDIYFYGPENKWNSIIIEKGLDSDTCIENAIVHFVEENKTTTIDESNVSIKVNDQVWTGKPITPAAVVKCFDEVLVKDTDFVLSYTNNTNVGKATITITGIGNYEGTVTKIFKINPASLSDATVTGISNKSYTGSLQTQYLTVKVGDKTLINGADYTVSYKNNTNAGTATVTINGKGNYTGTKTSTFTINCASISNVIVSGLNTKTYTGKALTQSPVVKNGSYTLKEGTDYTVSYKNNINAGTATVTITGKGNYTGTKTASFNINKAAQSIAVKTSAVSIAVGKTATVSITGAVGAKSYKSSLATVAAVNAAGTITAKKVGSATITATAAATANYKAATKTVSIKVVPAATFSITAANQATGIKLTWKSVAGATGYRIYRGSNLIRSITSGSTITCTDTTANTNGTLYTFRVVPTAPTGAGLARNLAVYRLARPAVSSVKNSAARKITVRWKKNAKANGYQIQYNTNSKFASGNKTVNITRASTVSRVIGGIAKGKTYYVRIRTYKTVGNSKWWSAWSPARSVKINK